MPTSNDDFPVLSIDERDRRWNAARALMEEQEVDALLVFSDRDGAGSPLWAVDHWLTNDQVGTYVVFPRTGVPIVHTWSPNPMLRHRLRSRSPQLRVRSPRSTDFFGSTAIAAPLVGDREEPLAGVIRRRS